jgi:hypothetical protein
MWQEAAEFYDKDQDKADEIISKFTHIPVAALRFSRTQGLAEFIVRPAIQEKANIDRLLAGFKSVGFLNDLPAADFYYDWPGLAQHSAR